MNLLYLADPNMIHDLKWMHFFSGQHTAFLLVRKCHADLLGEANFSKIEQTYNLKIVGIVDDFSVRHFWQTYTQAKTIKAIIKEYKIDLFHLMYAEPNALWANFRYSFNVPMLLTTRGTDVLKTIPLFFEKTGMLAKLVCYLYKRAFSKIEHITCTSTRQIKAINTYLKRDKNLHLIRTGIDVSAIQETATIPLPSDLASKKYILFPRLMQPIYNHEFALESIAKLPKEILNNYTFVFVHRNSPEQDYVQKILNLMSKIDTTFIFLDALAPNVLFQLYKSAQVVVMTPLSDGTPVTALESMACAVPTIVSPLEYDMDLFGEGIYILKNWDSTELSTVIANILDKTLVLDIKTAQKNVLERANRTKEMQKLGEIYTLLLHC